VILIAFRHSDRRLFSRLVIWLRGGDSAHVESAIPSAPPSLLSFCVSASFLDGGVRGKAIDITSPDKWRVYAWNPGQSVDLMQWLGEHHKKRYDLRGLFGIVLPRLGNDADKMFCSEAVAMHLGLHDPHTYDLVRLESAVADQAQRVVWSGANWHIRE
jgi:hypothetical protein